MSSRVAAIAAKRSFRVPLGLLLVALGCASNAPFEGPRPVQEAGLVENAATGPAVRIGHAEDRRDFARLGGLVVDDARDPVDQARAVAQGTGPGGANGVVLLLPPDLSVELLAAESMARALRGAGFRVLEQGDEDYELATPLDVGVEQLWLERNARNAPAHVKYEIRVRLSGPLPGLEAGVVSDVNGKMSRGGFSRALWGMALSSGLDAATKEAQTELDAVRTSVLQAAATSPLAFGGSGAEESAPTPIRAGGPIDFGRYFVLAIGIDDYTSLPPLRTAVADATAVAELLGSAYGFETELLLDATRSDLINAFSRYRDTLTERDNLLVYYAGHGWNDMQAGLGYWLPVDASEKDETNWVSNAKITSILRAMRAKHVMIVSDSCYSGTLTRGIRIKRQQAGYLARLAARRTRIALASGGNEPVADGGGGPHSVFASAFLAALEANEDVLDATQLHAQIRTPVMEASDQTPQFGPIRTAQHADGDFLFVRPQR